MCQVAQDASTEHTTGATTLKLRSSSYCVFVPDRQFPVSLVKGPKDARLPLGKVKLCIQGQNLCIVTLGLSPPEVLSSWHVTDLRRFGVIDNKFCFEGGSQCGQTGGWMCFHFRILMTQRFVINTSDIV